jgi:hypothetical protein
MHDKVSTEDLFASTCLKPRLGVVPGMNGDLQQFPRKAVFAGSRRKAYYD